jgi:hypothetical protein
MSVCEKLTAADGASQSLDRGFIRCVSGLSQPIGQQQILLRFAAQDDLAVLDSKTNRGHTTPTKILIEELFQPFLTLSVERLSFQANNAPHTLTVSWLGLV